MIVDYRYDPFLDVINIKEISDESHVVPTSSPFTIRLNEVPQCTDPSTLIVRYEDGTQLQEVAAQPTEGQFWADCRAMLGDNWNTGTLLFNSADGGRTVLVSYNGMGTLTDDRLPDMAELEVTGSSQKERYSTVSGASGYDTDVTSGSGSYVSTTSRLYQHTGLAAGTHTLRSILQQLINMSHTHEYYRSRSYYDCQCTWQCDCDVCGQDDAG